MIDTVLGYARGYNADQIRPFLRSLLGTGFAGMILMVADGGAAEESRRLGARVYPTGMRRLKVHSDRFLRWEEVLRHTCCEGVLLADTRDVVFQKDPSAHLPSEGLHAFLEDESMTLGTCPYNSAWIRQGYGEEKLKELEDHPISCVGTSCGDWVSVLRYLEMMVEEVKRIQPRTSLPQDQAAHNFIIRQRLQARIWANEEGEVYTVGYCPREGVRVVDDQIVNQAGKVPTIVHQWDRHQNLTELVTRRWS